MRYRSLRSRGGTVLDFNATPMIDVIFMLTVFFSLVGRFATIENIPMRLPQPDGSQAREAPLTEREVLNCVPADERDPSAGVLYSVGPNPPEPLWAIVRHLAAAKATHQASGTQLKVVIRADRRLRFADVQPAMQAVASLEIPMLNVGAEAGEAGG